jgi:hypothetical protein
MCAEAGKFWTKTRTGQESPSAPYMIGIVALGEATATLISDFNEIRYTRHAGSVECRMLGIVTLSPGVNSSAQSHHVTVGLDCDMVRVNLRIAFQSFLNLVLHARGAHFRFELDFIGNTFNATQWPDHPFGFFALVLPLRRTLKCDPSFGNRHLDGFGYRKVPVQLSSGR